MYADTVKCDIQFGNIDRTTKEDDSVQKAQFEICAHKYVNLDGEDYGIALLNRCKYGHRVKNGLLSLALLRAPVFPDPECDRGKHRISYAIYPHKESFDSSDVIAKAYCYNNTVILHKADPKMSGMVSVDNNDIVIETVKVAESGKGIIVRAYEAKGKIAQTKMAFEKSGVKAYECDMLENKLRNIDLNQLSFAPFEIKTILIDA